MRFSESLWVAFRGLYANALRSTLTMLGIIIGVAAVITMIGVGDGAQKQVAKQIRSLGANLLMVTAGTPRESGARLEPGSGHTLTEADAAAIQKEIPNVSVAAPSIRGSAQIIQGNRNWNTTVNGTEPGYFIARDWALSAGRYFSARDVEAAAKVAVIGDTVAKSLFGDENPVGKTVRIADVPMTVVGMLSVKGPSGSGRNQDDIVFVPISTAKLRMVGSAHESNRGAVAYVLVKVADAKFMEVAEHAIRTLLRQRHRLNADADDDFMIRNTAALMAAQKQATRTLKFLLAAVASISLVVGGISIMNIMLVSVTERTREIGLRLAVGASRAAIREQFLIEAVTLCLIGGVLGILLGIAAAFTTSYLAGWPVFVGIDAIFLAAAFAIGIGIFFGFYPALKASRLIPIEALRFE